MIVCSCTVLTKARVVATAEELARQTPGRPVTPGRVFRELGVKPNCTGCFSLIRNIVAQSGVMFTCPEPLASEAEEDSVTAAE